MLWKNIVDQWHKNAEKIQNKRYLKPFITDHHWAWVGYHASHDDVIKWKHFPRNWPFVRGIHRPGEFPMQRPVTRSFDVYFDLRLNKRLSKQSWGWWLETLSCSLWRQSNVGVPWCLCFGSIIQDKVFGSSPTHAALRLQSTLYWCISSISDDLQNLIFECKTSIHPWVC